MTNKCLHRPDYNIVIPFVFYSDEEDGGNPMVAGFQDDLDSDDEREAQKVAASRPRVLKLSSQDVELSSESEEEDNKEQQNIPVITQDQEDINSDLDQSKPDIVKEPEQPSLSALDFQSLEHSGSTKHSPSLEKKQDPEAIKPSHVAGISATVKGKFGDNSSDSEDSDEVDRPVVSHIEDDISEDDTTTSSKPVDSGLATDTTQVSQLSITST